jgi:YVTN family beta-propeller protein
MLFNFGSAWALVRLSVLGALLAVAGVAQAQTTPMFVLNSLDATVSLVDPVAWKEIRRIPTGKEPHHLYLTPDQKSLIIANAMGDSLLFVDPRTGDVQKTLRGIVDPYHLQFSPDMQWLVTAANRLNHVDVYRWDGENPHLVKRIPTGKTPSHMWINSSSTTAYVSMQGSNEVVAIDLPSQTLKWRGKTGATPADVFGTYDDKHLLVALTGGTGIDVFDLTGSTPTWIKTLPTGAGAHAFRAAGDKRHVYVSNRVANTISKVDFRTLQVVDEYPAPGGPDCMDVSPDGKIIYVGSRWARKLTMIDTTTRKVVRDLRVGRSPHGVWTLHHAPLQ